MDLTDAVISAVAAKGQPVAFLLWGVCAKAKARLIDGERYVVVPSTHPSPLSQKASSGAGHLAGPTTVYERAARTRSTGA